MIRFGKFLFKAIVVCIWAVFTYACVQRAADDISFWRAMGGGF